MNDKNLSIESALQYDQITDEVPDENQNQPLLFQGKEMVSADNLKTLEGRQVKCIASLIDYFVPGSSGVSAFHGAKVPIVRYFDTNIHSSVDLSVINM